MLVRWWDGSYQFAHLHQNSGQRGGLFIELLEELQQAFFGKKALVLRIEQFVLLAVNCIVGKAEYSIGEQNSQLSFRRIAENRMGAWERGLLLDDAILP